MLRESKRTGTDLASGHDPTDDRAAFETHKRTLARGMANDRALRASADALLIDADKHGYGYLWSWLGVPMIQIPPDIVVLQEVVWETKPTLVIETGIARGGSIVFFASMMALLGRGRVVGVDIDVRDHNRRSIETHPLAERVPIALIEGSSLASDTVERVTSHIRPDDRVMVVLDSNHTHEHVLEELERYAPFVTSGQMLVVCDTVVEQIPAQTHRPRPWGPGNNPMTALDQWQRDHPIGSEFHRDPFIDDKLLLTSSPRGYLRRG